MIKNILIEDYTYNLLTEKIASHPIGKRDASKLLVYKEGEMIDSVFSDLPSFILPETVLVINDSRVIEARIFFTKPTGGRVEIFCLQPHKPAEMTLSLSKKHQVQWQCLIGGASKWKQGQVLKKELIIDDKKIDFHAYFIAKELDHFIIEFRWNSDHSFAEVLHAAGTIPLPPYIKRNSEEIDKERYQTIFAKHEGSVAAPTAALHFTENVFNALASKNIAKEQITLHVGAGTFKPVQSETIAEHQMHAEIFSVNANTIQSLINASNIIAVGTTSLRALESLYWIGIKVLNGKAEFNLNQWEPYETDITLSYKESLKALLHYMQQQQLQTIHCSTSLLIMPGYPFKSANALITNFHQPRSTLLLLIAAFIGDAWKQVYDHALNNDYRFLSYGDSSLLFRKEL